MSSTEGVPESQFGEPRGVRGWLAAKVIGRLTGEANQWMVDCLDLRSDDRFLDVGCGPGLAVAMAASRAADGFAAGVDASATMVRQARRRNRAAVAAGRAKVERADAASLPFPDGHFDKAGSLNSMQFWACPQQGLRELHRVLVPGGRAVVVLMARSDDPPAPAHPAWISAVAETARSAGLGQVGLAHRDFGGVTHWALHVERS